MSKSEKKFWVVCTSKSQSIPFVGRGPRMRPFVLSEDKIKHLESMGYKLQIRCEAELDDKGRVVPMNSKEFTAISDSSKDVIQEVVPEVQEDTSDEPVSSENVEEVSSEEIDPNSMSKDDIVAILIENDIDFDLESSEEELRALLNSLLEDE